MPSSALTRSHRRQFCVLLGTWLTLAAGLLIGIHQATAAGAGPAASAATLTVCPSGCMYSSIETALENAVPGDAIQVGPGEYYESIWLRGGVRVQGAGAGQSFIIWEGTAPAVIGYPHDLEGAVLDGFTIVCHSPNSAIHIDYPHEKQIISNNVISNSVGQWHSGGIYIAFGATPMILDNTFVGNTLSDGDGGGAIFVDDAAPVIRGNTFISNHAKNGGAIAVYNETYYRATITYNTFVNNSAGSMGGAIHIDNASPIIRDNRIERNSAVSGGGICATGRSGAVIQGNEIASNTAAGGGSAGGGIYVSGTASLLVDSNVIRDNHAAQGGGVYAENAGLDITNNVLLGNDAAQILLSTASPRIANNTVLGGGGAASAVLHPASPVSLLHPALSAGLGRAYPLLRLVFSARLAEQAGVGIDLLGWSNPGIANNIIAFEAYGIRGDGAAQPTIRYNDLWQNATDYSGVAAEPNNLSVEPSLRDAASGDVHLQASSALIDAGTLDGAPSHDFEGDARPMDGDRDGVAVPDIGADEYPGPVPARTPTPSSTPGAVATRTPVPSSPTPNGTEAVTPTPSSTRGAVATPTGGPPPSSWQETEDGTIEPPMTTGVDPEASNGQYVYSPQPYAGQVSVSLAVPGGGDYELWGRVSADHYGADSFWVTVDGGAQATWDIPVGGWAWVAVTNRESAEASAKQVYLLAAGWHQVVVHAREPGARLDVLELREVGAGPPPSPTVTATPSQTATGTATPTSTATQTPAPTGTASPTPTATPTLTPTGTATPQPTFHIALPLVVK